MCLMSNYINNTSSLSFNYKNLGWKYETEMLRKDLLCADRFLPDVK